MLLLIKKVYYASHIYIYIYIYIHIYVATILCTIPFMRICSILLTTVVANASLLLILFVVGFFQNYSKSISQLLSMSRFILESFSPNEDTSKFSIA